MPDKLSYWLSYDSLFNKVYHQGKQGIVYTLLSPTMGGLLYSVSEWLLMRKH